MKKLLLLVPIVALLAAGCNSSQPTTEQTQPTPTPQQQITQTPTATPTTNQSGNFKTYSDTKSGISFQYPSSWTLNGYDGKTPNLLVNVNDINTFSTDCEGLGGCQQNERKLEQQIANGTAKGLPNISGIVSFQGGKGFLSAGCSGNEGGDGVPTPFYKLQFYNGDTAFVITLNDLSNKLQNVEGICEGNAYFSKIKVPNKTSSTGYQPYNDFIALISTLKLTK